MQYYAPFLQWIDHQGEHMAQLVEAWGNINSGSYNRDGLAKQMIACKEAFSRLGGEMQELVLPHFEHVDSHGNTISQPLGKALHIVKRPTAEIRIFLCGHMDTVYGAESPFQKVVKKDNNTLLGPGVADMKGGLVVLLTALEAFEKSPYASKICWELLITPDEEIGSPGSKSILERAAKRNHFGLLFEPSFPDGSLVSERGGSMNFTIITRGVAAHVGRDFANGRSALFALCPLIAELEKLNSKGSNPEDEVIVNVGELHSGTGFNVVAELAVAKVNLRSSSLRLMEQAKEKIEQLIKHYGEREGIQMKLIEGSCRYPKIIDTHTEELIQWLSSCGEDLGIKVLMRPTKGVSDGNFLSGFGLSNIDTLGAIGGEIHSPREYIHLDSLVARAKLTALFLMKAANSEFQLQKPTPPIAL